jgi:CBS domain-containing protein
MRNFQNHLITASSTLREGLIAINRISDGILCLFVLDEQMHLVGTLTDGDIRRALISGIVLSDKIERAMMKNFEKIKDYEITPSRIRMLREKGIKLLPFIDENGRINRVYNLVEKKSLLPFDAVLMAGGKGIRLRPMTEKTPKPLLRIGEKSIIDINIDRLINFGIEHIHITVNYLAEQIQDLPIPLLR